MKLRVHCHSETALLATLTQILSGALLTFSTDGGGTSLPTRSSHRTTPFPVQSPPLLPGTPLATRPDADLGPLHGGANIDSGGG